MTLQQKFNQWLNTKPNETLRDIQCEIISYDFAIGFAKWILSECDSDIFIKNEVDELLQIYKKEKGL